MKETEIFQERCIRELHLLVAKSGSIISGMWLRSFQSSDCSIVNSAMCAPVFKFTVSLLSLNMVVIIVVVIIPSRGGLGLGLGLFQLHSAMLWHLTYCEPGWAVRRSNPGGGRDFPHRPWCPPSLLYNGCRGKAAGAWL